MIWYWLAQLVRRIVWLIRPPAAASLARVSPTSSCPVCGAQDNILRAVQRASGKGTEVLVYCQHTCSQCGARWHEAPVVKVNTSLVWPALARTELEKSEDAEAYRGMGVKQ